MNRATRSAHWAIRASLLLTVVTVLLTGCTPAGGNAGSPAASAPSSGPKTLVMGITTADGEPNAGGFAFGATSTGKGESANLLHAGLTNHDDMGNVQARIIEGVPTVENGDWKILPDGKMEMTWRLRKDAVWHDGNPLVADDIILGFKVGNDPELFAVGTRVLRQIADLTAVNANTVLMRWKNTYVFANDLGLETMVPLPNHRMGQLYETATKEAFGASPQLTDEWIGLGPYRLKDWQRGSFMEFQAFDQYVLGRPKIDRLIIRMVGDSNALVVRTTAGEIQVVPVGILGEGEAFTLKNQLEPSGAGKVIMPNVALVIADWQLKDPSLPWAKDSRVRLGLLKLIDRQIMVDSVLNGLSEVGDQLMPTSDPAYQLAKQKGLPDTSYNPTEGHRLLAAAGWTRDASGTYRSATGDPFSMTVLVSGDVYTRVQLALALTSQWKTAGIDAKEHLQPGTLDRGTRDVERATVSGIYYSRQRYAPGLSPNYRTSEIANEASRYRGSNTGGYSNPTFDGLVDRFEKTVAKSERDQLTAEMSKHLLDEMVYMPTVTSSESITVLKNVHGVTSLSGEILRAVWNVHTWDID